LEISPGALTKKQLQRASMIRQETKIVATDRTWFCGEELAPVIKQQHWQACTGDGSRRSLFLWSESEGINPLWLLFGVGWTSTWAQAPLVWNRSSRSRRSVLRSVIDCPRL